MTVQVRNSIPSYYEKRKLHVRYSAMVNKYTHANIATCWLLPDNIGRDSFTTWLHGQYLQLPSGEKWRHYCLVRKNKNLPWSPDNAELITLKEYWANVGRCLKVPDADKKAIVQLAKDKPGITLRDVTKIYPYSIPTISNILRKALGMAKNGKRPGAKT